MALACCASTASAFTSPALGAIQARPAVAMTSVTRGRRAAVSSLRMQEPLSPQEEEPVPPQAEPVKRTSGFGQVFSSVKDGLTAETRIVGEDGKRRLKASPQQIVFLVVAQFAIPILLVLIYRAVKGSSGFFYCTAKPPRSRLTHPGFLQPMAPSSAEAGLSPD
eukprot:CAMPEP_0180233904 /NCGR_PEP_ID=MMETSP0987-20121128/28343_1 /TAXON_ID=697907 /ORGANISM="non described non described, Strain CCMP2293" /LENGTH=163 /DNA_ID=CAMNT_0022199791 /DNA_START=68 /DNA_END=557 /DNA_ORIENTATION=-